MLALLTCQLFIITEVKVSCRPLRKGLLCILTAPIVLNHVSYTLLFIMSMARACLQFADVFLCSCCSTASEHQSASICADTMSMQPHYEHSKQFDMHCCAGNAVEEGLQWDIKLGSSDELRSNRVNKSLAAMLTLRWVAVSAKR